MTRQERETEFLEERKRESRRKSVNFVDAADIYLDTSSPAAGMGLFMWAENFFVRIAFLTNFTSSQYRKAWIWIICVGFVPV